MPASTWRHESKERFLALLPEIQAGVARECGEERLSQDKFGAYFSVSGTTIQGWEKGSIPETPKLKRVAGVLSWSLDELVCYLETGIRPEGQSQMNQILYKLNNLPLRDVAMLIEAGAKRLAAEVTDGF